VLPHVFLEAKKRPPAVCFKLKAITKVSSCPSENGRHVTGGNSIKYSCVGDEAPTVERVLE
jgi:hypothetical protein